MLLLLFHETTSWMNLCIFQVSTIIHCSPGYIIYAAVTQRYTAGDFRARTQLRGACPAPLSFPYPCGLDWWRLRCRLVAQFGRLRTCCPCNFSTGLCSTTEGIRAVSHQVNLEQSREQESVLLICPYRWFYPFVWGERGELDSKSCMFILAHGVGNRNKEVTGGMC